MEVSTISKYNRISPKKVRLISAQLSGKKVSFALESLRFMNQKASLMLAKTLKTAQADATHNFKLNGELLVVKTIDVTGGPSLKRFTPRSRGMGHPILKRSSHIRVVLEERAVVEAASPKAAAKVVAKEILNAEQTQVEVKEPKTKSKTEKEVKKE